MVDNFPVTNLKYFHHQVKGEYYGSLLLFPNRKNKLHPKICRFTVSCSRLFNRCSILKPFTQCRDAMKDSIVLHTCYNCVILTTACVFNTAASVLSQSQTEYFKTANTISNFDFLHFLLPFTSGKPAIYNRKMNLIFLTLRCHYNKIHVPTLLNVVFHGTMNSMQSSDKKL